ncbi:MAG TPA: hypothetical protein PJ984_04060 [Candidatus Saccharibacteria bacterium]|jgi:hypothetical protein|nr:hypothetical protein [Patescibacteria group bacterium]HMS31543.1 hypothetical protein [Candidatus Saccharibacteria bacterium]
MFGKNKNLAKTEELPAIFRGNLADISPEVAANREQRMKESAGRVAVLRQISGEVPVVKAGEVPQVDPTE